MRFPFLDNCLTYVGVWSAQRGDPQNKVLWRYQGRERSCKMYVLMPHEPECCIRGLLGEMKHKRGRSTSQFCLSKGQQRNRAERVPITVVQTDQVHDRKRNPSFNLGSRQCVKGGKSYARSICLQTSPSNNTIYMRNVCILVKPQLLVEMPEKATLASLNGPSLGLLHSTACRNRLQENQLCFLIVQEL